jgi:hypothetical protein
MFLPTIAHNARVSMGTLPKHSHKQKMPINHNTWMKTIKMWNNQNFWGSQMMTNCDSLEPALLFVCVGGSAYHETLKRPW